MCPAYVRDPSVRPNFPLELGNFARAEELTQEALEIVRERGDVHEVAVQSQNLAHLLAVFY